MSFKINKKSKLSMARAGILETAHGKIKTPFFMPIATRGVVRGVTSAEMKSLGAEILLGNTYHLMLRPGVKILKKYRGLHNFMNWSGPILTDSGGYQVFSLGAKNKKNNVKITERGVEFTSHIDGKKHFLTPEDAIEIQKAIGSDIMMVLDECPPYPVNYDYAKKSLELTTRWAARCKNQLKTKKQLLFGIVQGSVYKDLREYSAKKLVELNFDGYAIGGVAVGEPREKMHEILKWVAPILPENKPRYLMGLGKPEELVEAVKNGIDMFDCVIPTREARHSRLYVRKRGKLSSRKSFYSVVNISNAKFAQDLKPLDKNCRCEFCTNYSRAYLHHLFKIGDTLSPRLATLHNLNFYLRLMEDVREEIKAGKI